MRHTAAMPPPGVSHMHDASSCSGWVDGSLAGDLPLRFLLGLSAKITRNGGCGSEFDCYVPVKPR